MSKYLFTSESVTEGHPDKICDQISDAILDEALRQDPRSRVAAETFVTTGQCFVMGEITTAGSLDYEAIARKVIADIGYTRPEYGFDTNCRFVSSIDAQSADIAMGVDKALEAKENKMSDEEIEAIMSKNQIVEFDEITAPAIMKLGNSTRRLSSATTHFKDNQLFRMSE